MPTGKFTFDSYGIGELLRRGRLLVPPNQRPYAWEERHVQNLFQDLNEAITNDEEDYFLGTIVLIQAGKVLPSISDGQQRIATTSILLARIRDRQYLLKRAQRAAAMDSDYLRTIDMDTEERVSKLRLNVEDHGFFVDHILPSPTDDGYRPTTAADAIRPSNRKLLQASNMADDFITDIVKPLRPEAQSDYLNRWVKFIRDNASIVVVTAPDEIGAYRMFETLNDRGLKASQADILKNYLFSKAGPRLAEAQMLWNTVTTAVESLGDDENERLVTFIRHLWILSHGPTKERELAGSIKTEITGESRALSFLIEASHAVQDYVALWSSRHSKWSGYKSTTRQSIDTIAHHLRVEQIRPLLFAVARHFDPVEADKAFRLFVSWSVRFLIYGGRGGMLDQQYSLRAQDIGTKRITKARELRSAMENYVPTDTEFEGAFATARVSRAHLARYYLRAIEKTTKNDPQPEYVENEEIDQITLDHVLPLNPGDEWDVNEEEADAVQKQLGNMVLLRANQNRDLGNGGFGAKRALYSQSGYNTTRMVSEYDRWGTEQIRRRQADLAKIAVRTWSTTFAD